jgi:secreted PhoX family phosphatase
MTQLQIAQEEVEDSNTSNNPHFDTLLQARLSRRSVLGGGVGMTAAMMFGGVALTGCGSSDDSNAATPPVTPDAPKSLTFAPVAKNKLDVVTVPADYEVSVLYALGDPIINSVDVPAWKDDGMQSGASFEFRSGDCHDGMHYFGLTDAGKIYRYSLRSWLVVCQPRICDPNLFASQWCDHRCRWQTPSR